MIRKNSINELEKSFNNTYKLFNKYLNEGLELESEVAYYANAQFHRKNSKVKQRDFSLIIHCIKVFVSTFINVKFKFSTKTEGKNVILWMDNYQFEQYDDAPLKEQAEKLGYSVLEPSLTPSSLFYSFKNLFFIIFNLNKAIKRFSSDYVKNSSDLNLSEKDVCSLLKSTYFINQLIRARCFNYPFVSKVINSNFDKNNFFVIYRSNGDITPLLVYKFLNNKIKSSPINRINQILYAHASLPVSVPLTMVSLCVELILTKNEVSNKILKERSDSFGVSIRTVGDPRALIANRTSQNENAAITLALTEYENGFLNENHNVFDLNFINSLLINVDKSLNLNIKRRYYNNYRANSALEGLVRNLQTDKNIIESVNSTRVAFVLGNSKLKMISSVFMDYYQVGIPTAIIVPDESINDLRREWKIGFDTSLFRIIGMTEAIEILSSRTNLESFITSFDDSKIKTFNPLDIFFEEIDRLANE